MSTIQRSEIESLITFFNRRGLKFYHACQYKDFKTYIELGGVPSRNLMEQSGLPYTAFDTDNKDRYNEVWNKVFGNLENFGFGFAQGRSNPNTAPTPNPYGPILLIFKPEVFREATDVAICLRSAGGTDFNRENEALPDIATVTRMFEYPNIADAPTEYAKSYIKYSAKLREEFQNPSAMTPEVSCIVDNERLSFAHLSEIQSDLYVINKISLHEKVRELKIANRLNGTVSARRYNDGRLAIKQEIANLNLNQLVSIPQIIANTTISNGLRAYATRLQRGGIAWQYDRYARYLRGGTLALLNEEGGLSRS
jgi:hypothetical protein